jgi:hypothetical protein
MLLHYIACNILRFSRNSFHSYTVCNPLSIQSFLTPPQNYDALNSGPTLEIPNMVTGHFDRGPCGLLAKAGFL